MIEPKAIESIPAGYDLQDMLQPIAILSIAISIKRIADAIEGVPYDTSTGADNSRHRAGLVDAIGTAIEQGILAAGANR